MIPNMNPGQMKKLMQQMGIKNIEIPATKVTVEKEDGSQLVVENPQVMMIEMGGSKTLQVSGEFTEKEGKGDEKEGQSEESKDEKEKTDADIVMEQTNATREKAEAALHQAKGDIAEAIMLIEAKK